MSKIGYTLLDLATCTYDQRDYHAYFNIRCVGF